MTVIENLQPRVQYTYANEEQQYPITFSYIERSDVQCMVREQVLEYNVHYTIPLFDATSLSTEQLYLELLVTPEQPIGNVTIAVGDKITIYRDTPKDQQAEFPQNAKFSSQKITEAVDKLTMIGQELNDDLSTCIKLSKTTPTDFNTELPTPAANQVLQWNEDGTQLINYDLRGEIEDIEDIAEGAVDTANEAKTIAQTAAGEANEALSKSNTAITNAATALDTAEDCIATAASAEENVEIAVSVANQAASDASTAVTKANAANTTANFASTVAGQAKTIANAASSTADTANSKAQQAIETANQAAYDAEQAVSTAEQAASDAEDAVDTATTASNNATTAMNTANTAEGIADTASTNASTALSKANTAIATANSAASDASSAVNIANTASTKALAAVNTANTASTNASNAVNTANTASTNASTALSNSETALETATNADAKVDEFGEDIESVIEAAEKINELEEAVAEAVEAAEDATTAATNATTAATNATTAAVTASQKAQEATQAAASIVLDTYRVVYGTTTYSQVATAITNNKVPLLDTGNNKYGILTAHYYDASIIVDEVVYSGSCYVFQIISGDGYTATLYYLFNNNDWVSDITNLGTVRTVNNVQPVNGNITLTIPAAQIQSDWSQTDNTQKDFIKNKPTIPTAQIQSDWNQSDNTQKDFIKNKPTIPIVPTTLSSFTDDLGANPIHTHSQYLTAHQDISGKENSSNKTNSLSSSSTTTQYPNAKITFDSIRKYSLIQDINTLADGTISLNYANSLHKRVITANTTFTFSTTNLSLTSSIAYTFELLVTMSTVYTLAFPNSVTWANGETPDTSETGTYYFVFRTVDAGSTWHGNLEGKW